MADDHDTTVLGQLGYPEGVAPESADHFEARMATGTAAIWHAPDGWTWQCQVRGCDDPDLITGYYEIPQDAEKAARRHLQTDHAQQEVRGG